MVSNRQGARPPRLRSARSSGGILLWIIPADAHGAWTLELDGADTGYLLELAQHYQRIELAAFAPAAPPDADPERWGRRSAELRGDRLGFTVDNVRLAWNALDGHAGVESVTLMTHFADADGEGGVAAQLQWFRELTQPFDAPCSLANSAALLRYPEQTHADWVRPGIMLYGATPFAYQSAESLGLQPVMTLRSQLIAVRELAANDSVGYGANYTATRAHRIGVVACGYADGYPRHAPNGTPVLVCGRRARIAGRVSMDMITVDLTDVPEARVGSPVVLWGEGLPVDDVAAAASTIGYELLCALAPRVPVVTTRVGRIDLEL